MSMVNSYQSNENLYKIIKRLAHDLRSPISGLKMWSEHTVSRLPEDERDMLEKITQRIENSLDATLRRIENKEAMVTVINLHMAIKNILQEKRNEYLGQDIDFIYDRPANFAEINVPMAEDDLARLLSNLINNAKDACSGKAGVIKIELSMIKQNIVLSIQDNGKGIPEDILAQLRNGIAITHGKASGSGIGLQQVRDAITKLNGNLVIDSTCGVGTKLSLHFNLGRE
jgi:signal transduction histidine kinase